MLTVRQYVPEDGANLVGGTLEWGPARPLNSAIWAQKHAQEGPAWTGTVDGDVIGAGGVHLFWDGVGEAWVELSPKAVNHAKSVFRAIKRGLQIVWTAHTMKRIQATARVDMPSAHRLLEHLGFVREGRLRSYGQDGSDSYMYAYLGEP